MIRRPPPSSDVVKLRSPTRRIVLVVIGVPSLILGLRLIQIQAFYRPEINYLLMFAGLCLVATGVNGIMCAIWPLWWARKSS